MKKPSENIIIEEDVDSLLALKKALDRVNPLDRDDIIGVRFSYVSPIGGE
jgi:hypothetical protein